jgi:hypothetical protein
MHAAPRPYRLFVVPIRVTILLGLHNPPHRCIGMVGLHEKGKAKAVETVCGDRTTWPASHVAGPAGHHLVSNQLNQVSDPSLDPYKYPSIGGNQNTHDILEIPLAKLPFLV